MSDKTSQEKVTIFNGSFWDLWIQKLLRNIASVKYQFMVAFFVIVVAGMFYVKVDGSPLISPSLGLSFLAGGFVTLATARIYIRTRLTEEENRIYSRTRLMEEENDEQTKRFDTDK